MPSSFPTRFIFAALLLCSLPSLRAQDGGDVSLQFLSFPQCMDPKPVELVVGEKKTLKVELPCNELSHIYKAPRLESWIFGETATGEDGKPTFKVYGNAKSIAAPSQLLLLIRKGANNSDGFEVVVLPNDLQSFGGGKFLFVNAAKVEVGGKIGGETFALNPGRNKIVKPKADKDGRNMIVEFAFRKDNEAKPFFSSVWPANEHARGLIFFYHDPESQRLRIHSIRDFPSP